MVDADQLTRIEEAAGKSGIRQAPMERLVSFGCGGPAALLIEADDAGQLAGIMGAAVAEGVPWFVVGRGSNLLVADSGFDGLVVILSGKLRECEVAGDTLVCGGGAALPRAASLAAEHGLSGLEPLAHIPGTVGGAVVINAGAFGAEIGPLVKTVHLCVPGSCRTLEQHALEFGYRSSNLGEGLVIAEVVLGLKKGDRASIVESMHQFQSQRQDAQPRGGKTFGSVFKNPPGGESAGRMLDSVGCKGLRVGGAAVSREHANFIVNEGNATTADVIQLMDICRSKVTERFGVVLQPEVHLLGAAGLERF